MKYIKIYFFNYNNMQVFKILSFNITYKIYENFRVHSIISLLLFIATALLLWFVAFAWQLRLPLVVVCTVCVVVLSVYSTAH